MTIPCGTSRSCIAIETNFMTSPRCRLTAHTVAPGHARRFVSAGTRVGRMLTGPSALLPGVGGAVLLLPARQAPRARPRVARELGRLDDVRPRLPGELAADERNHRAPVEQPQPGVVDARLKGGQPPAVGAGEPLGQDLAQPARLAEVAL